MPFQIVHDEIKVHLPRLFNSTSTWSLCSDARGGLQHDYKMFW